MDKNKLILPSAIVLAAIIAGGFFYATQVNKQKSIEKQQQIELKAKADAEQAKKDQESSIILGKMFCVDEAEKAAVELYKDYCNKANYCDYKEGQYLTPQYENAYNKCLQRKGLK